MVKMSRAHNMGAGSKLKSQTHPCKTKKSLKSVATENIHSPAPGAPLARITFRHPFSKKHINKLAKASSRNRGTVISRHLHYDTSRYTLKHNIWVYEKIAVYSIPTAIFEQC